MTKTMENLEATRNPKKKIWDGLVWLVASVSAPWTMLRASRLVRNLRRIWREGQLRSRLRKIGDTINIQENVKFFGESNISIGNGVQIERGAILGVYGEQGQEIVIGDNVSILSGSKIFAGGGNVHVGDGSVITYECNIFSSGSVAEGTILNRIEIGENVIIGPHVVITSGQHSYEDPSIPIKQQPDICRDITIEDDVWIGANVSIIPGVRIGKGSVIGAGAVVIDNIPPFSVAAGVPAKVLKKRG